MRGAWQDWRYSARILRLSPGFSVAAILSLALGIGASTAVFSIADTVFLRPLPYPDAARLTWVAIRFPDIKAAFVPSPDYVAWRRENRVFEQLGATQAGGNTLMVMNSPEPAEVHAARVSFNFLATFAVTPALGRDFTPQEELPNGPKAVLLTDRFWRQHFHSIRKVTGQVITLDGQPYTIAGVLPSSFVFPMDVKVDLLTTLPVSPVASHHDRSMATWAVFGRLKPGVAISEARANLAALFRVSKADAPLLFRSENTLLVQPLQQHRIGDARLLLLVLIAAVGCLLLIACANVANLLLGRWSKRSRELAVRAAIGAARGRLVRQLFTETVLLAVVGGGLGLLFVALVFRGFVHFAAGELPRLSEINFDTRVFAMALLVSLVTLLVFGALPALRAGRVDIQPVLQQGGGITGEYRLLRRSLVVAEVALSLVLLSGAALLLQTLWHLENDHLGFEPEHVLTASVPLRGTKGENDTRQTLAHELLSFTQRMPGTEAAALTQCSPLSSGPYWLTFTRSDRPLPEQFHRGDGIGVCGVGPDYFKASGIPLAQGRSFNEQDFAHPNTMAIINEAAARAYFPRENPLGKQIEGGRAAQWKTVVGIVQDAKNQGLNQPAMPEAFVNDLAPAIPPQFEIIVRSVGDQTALAFAIRGKLRSLDPRLFAKFETLDQAIGEMTAAPRFNSILLGSFASIAFVMAIIGVYGVLAFAVTRRTREIAIRIALGAEPRQVRALVVREGALLVGLGSAFGIAGAIGLTRYLSALLYNVSPTDPKTYICVVIGSRNSGNSRDFPAGAQGRLDRSYALVTARIEKTFHPIVVGRLRSSVQFRDCCETENLLWKSNRYE